MRTLFQLAMASLAILAILAATSVAGSAQSLPALVSHTASPTGAISPPINTTGANLIAVCGYANSTVTDSARNAYTRVYQMLGMYAAVNPALYVAFNPVTSERHTVSVSGGHAFTVSAYTGVASGPDQVVPTTSYGSNAMPLTLSPKKANELILGCYLGNYPRVTSSKAAFTGMTTNTPDGLTPGGNYGAADGYVVQKTAKPVMTTVTNTESNGASAFLASFYSPLNPASLAVTTASPLLEAVAGTPYQFCLNAIGGVRPFTWTKTAGTYPAGVSFNQSTGCFGGTPTATANSVPLTFSVTDAQSKTVTSSSLSLTVTSSRLSFGTRSCPGATQLTAYAGCRLKVTGGTGTYHYSIGTEGGATSNLPEGMVINPTTGDITSSKVNGVGSYNFVVKVADSGGASVSGPVTLDVNGNNTFGGLHLFPEDSIFHLRVDRLPVDTGVYAQELDAYAGQRLRFGFGRAWYDGGIPINTVGADQPLIPVNRKTFFFSEIDRTASPCDAVIENTFNQTGTPPGSASIDNHILTVQTGPKPMIYELYQGYPNYPSNTYGAPGCTSFGSGGQEMYGGAVKWDPTSYVARPSGTPAADAGGLCLTCYLLNYDEVSKGPAHHAIRMTMAHTLNYHVFPATVQAGLGSGSCSGGSLNRPGGNDVTGTYLIDQLHPPTSCSGKTTPGSSLNPMGEIYRLKAAVPEPAACASNPIMHNVFLTLKQYGAILADNGNSNTLIGTQDFRWPTGEVINNCLEPLHGRDMEPVLIQPSLVNWPKSYQTIGGARPGSEPGAH